MRRSSSSARRLVLCGAVVAASACALPRRAFAEEPAALVSRGLELRRERRDAEALTLFQTAYSSAAQPMILGQIALAEQALGRWLAAERDLSAVLATHDTWADANRSALEKALTVIQLHLSSLTVTSNVESAELWLDDQDLGKVGAQVRVMAGPHTLSLRAVDGRTTTRSVELTAGEREHFHLEFSEQPPAPAPPAPALVPNPAPPAPPPRAPEVRGAKPLDAHSVSTRRALAYGSAALAVLALGEAVTASLLRVHYAHHYNSAACAPERSLQCASDRDQANTWGKVAVVGYIVAGAAGLGSLALFSAPYWYPRTSTSSAEAGLSFSGKF
jgi:hypothetical protein